jgi:hypothetical protein
MKKSGISNGAGLFCLGSIRVQISARADKAGWTEKKCRQAMLLRGVTVSMLEKACLFRSESETRFGRVVGL